MNVIEEIAAFHDDLTTWRREMAELSGIAFGGIDDN